MWVQSVIKKHESHTLYKQLDKKLIGWFILFTCNVLALAQIPMHQLGGTFKSTCYTYFGILMLISNFASSNL